MNIWKGVDAVRIYPSGGVIYKRVQNRELQTVAQAIKQVMNNKPATIHLTDLNIFRCTFNAIRELKNEYITNYSGQSVHERP